MDHIMIKIQRLVIFSSVALPILCGAVGEFAVNIAYGKPTTQSSTYIGITEYGDTPGYPYDASLAVDGNTDTNFKSDGCSHTDLNSNSAWWEVDLLDLYNVLNITIYQRSDGNTGWLSGFVTKGKLSNDSLLIIDNPKSNMNGTITIPVNTSLRFKGIRIELNQKNLGIAAICLCEVQVMAEINVAEKKIAKQSSMYNKTSTSFSASLAVDGNTNTIFAEKSCSTTNPGDLNPWWSVDLQAVYFVIGIRIYQQMDAQTNRLKGFTLVGVHANGSNETIQTAQPYQTGEIVIHVAPPRMLKEIRVHLNHSDLSEGPIITLCEVQVFAGTMCPKPPPFPRKGIYKFIPGNEGNWSYNFSLKINCIEGYNIDGAISVGCEDINRWNGTFGSCSVKRCNLPLPQVDHGILTFKNGIDGNGTYNTTVTLNCNEGYKTSTGDQLRCVDKDQWQGTLAHCMVKRCNKPPPQITHGLLAFKDGIEGNTTYNSSVSLNCTEGYKRNSHAVLRCADDEQWQGTLGLCLVKRCNQLVPQVSHGVLAFRGGIEGNGTYNTSVSFNCVQGYKRDRIGQLRCADEDQWQGTLGLCLVKRCNKPPRQIAHGFLAFKDGIEGNTTYNASVSLNCTEGYKRNSHAVLRCADDEQWQGILGLCLVKRCKKPQQQIAHGFLAFKDGIEGNTTYNASVSLNCTEGYKRNSHAVLRCAEDEQWQGTLGLCLVKRCEKWPPQIAHGVLTFKHGLKGNGTYNTTVSLKCTEGYKRNSHAVLRCGDDEQWQGNLGLCLVKRCDEPLPQVSHGVLTFKDGLEGNGTYNTTVSLICNEGYKLNSTTLLRCADDEQYQGILGHCLVKRCNQTLPQVAHGILTFKDGIGGNATYNTTVTLNCNEGYKRSRDGQLRCTDEDHWQGTLGFCMVKKCNQTLPQIAHGILTFKNGIDGNGTYNTTVTLNCNEGYTRSGVGQLRCGDEDQWQGTLGFCAESLRSGEHKSSVAGIAGGVTATTGAIILGIIIAYFLYKRRARGTNDKMVETALNTIPSSSRRKGHNEEVILDTAIDAQPKKMERAEIDETKHEYMKSIDSSRDYYSFTSQKVPDKHSIRVDDLSSFFLSRKMEPGLYEEEYSKLPNGLIKSHEEALRPENKSKNRYKHIYPYDDTRVRLEIWDPNIENDYINACYINGFKTVRAYIAAQGPTKGVLNDFWRMVWQTKCSKIVMLTNLIEEGKHKCEQYWPDEGSVEYGDIVIRLVQCEKFSDFTIRTLELRKTVERTEEEKNKAIQVKQFHFTAWPDRGVPRFASSLNHFRYKIHTTKPRRNSEGPIVVHCSAGIGRTGTFLALDYLVDQAEEMGYINVVHCVENLRKQRVNLVQTLEQYIFVHEALVEALTCSTITMSTSEFQDNYRTLLERNNKTGKRKLDDRFEKLTMYVSDPGEDVYANANVMENRDKNRYHNILPDKNHCPYLNVYVKGRDSYINAVFLPAYKDDDMFVVTQTPLENTIVDFWRMVYQLEVSSIVMLNTLSEMKEEERYWTENDETLEIVPFRITLESKTSDDICTNYTMLLNYHDERRKVRLSRATYWADKTNVPNSPTAMLKQIDLIQRWQQETCKKPVVVHCMNGAERSGLFCVVAALLERTKIEHDVAVEDIIKQMRSRRPQLIPNVDQFKFCYDAVSAYIDLFDTYSNFTGL